MQPEIRHQPLQRFGFALLRQLAAGHLAILTANELILIRDDDSQSWLKDTPHGAVWTYIPLDKITAVSLHRDARDLLVLSFRLAGDFRIDYRFGQSKKAELDLLLAQF